MSYEPKLAAALSGATLRQLSHWRRASGKRGALLVPEISDSRPILYSFRDNRPMEVEAIARSGLHRIQYRQNNKHGGLVGLGTATATVCAALPHAIAELEGADGQRLVSLTAVDPSRHNRLQITDPKAYPPKHWPTS